MSIGFGRRDEQCGAIEASVESKSLVTERPQPTVSGNVWVGQPRTGLEHYANWPCWLASALAYDVTRHFNKISASRTDPSTPWQNRFVEVFQWAARGTSCSARRLFDSVGERRTVRGRSPARVRRLQAIRVSALPHASRVRAEVSGTERNPKCSQEVDR